MQPTIENFSTPEIFGFVGVRRLQPQPSAVLIWLLLDVVYVVHGLRFVHVLRCSVCLRY